VFPHRDGFAVYRLEGSHARLRPVELGGRNGSYAWVSKGLDAGDAVVIYPPSPVADGKRVKVRVP
jgi:HlyD family secretion protein